jgi:hypothetical protein
MWRMTSGLDADGDNRADAPAPSRDVRLERGLGTDLVLPPRQTIVFDFALAEAADDPSTRADIGVSAEDLAIRGKRLSVRVHSLGARPTPSGRVSLTDKSGRVIATAAFPPLEAPATMLQPHGHVVTMPLNRNARKGSLTVAVTLDGNPAEVTQANNHASLIVR